MFLTFIFIFYNVTHFISYFYITTHFDSMFCNINCIFFSFNDTPFRQLSLIPVHIFCDLKRKPV